MKYWRFFTALTAAASIALMPVQAFAADEDSKPASSSQAPATSIPPLYPEKKGNLPNRQIYDLPSEQIEAVADSLEYSKTDKKIIARSNVVVRYRDEHLTADYAEVDSATKQVHATGHVIVFHKDIPVAQGDVLDYNFETKSGSFPDGRGFFTPWFVTGKDSQQVSDNKKVIKDGSATTCNLAKPHYEVRGRSVTIIDNDKMIIRSAVIYVLGKPVFWLPYLIVPLKTGNLPFAVAAGYKSRFGYYIEATKGFSINKNIGGKFHLDWRSKRGVGGGADLNYDYGPKAYGLVKAYVTQDKKAPRTATGDNGFQNTEDRTRGRLTWVHRTDVNENTNVILRYNRIEDEFFLQEFFQKESRSEIEPQSFVTATHNTEKYGSVLHLEKQMNRFESLVERMPHLQLDWRDQNIGDSKYFYQSQFSFDALHKVFGRKSPDDEDVTRFDQFNEFTRPLSYNRVQFTPFVNLRETYFSRNRNSTSDRLRANFGAGADLRTQYYRTYGVEFEKIGMEVNQLRHVIEPLVQYKTDKPTMNPGTLGNFDSIDRIDDSDQVIVGLENRLQTKRVIDGKVRRVDIVSMNSYLTYLSLGDSGDFGSGLTNLHEGRTDSNLHSQDLLVSQDFTVRPYDWLQYQVRVDHSIRRNEVRSFNQDIVTKFKRLKFLFGQRYIDDIGTIPGGNQFVFETSWLINPLWKLTGYVRWDAEKDGRNEYQVMATRDMHDFLLDFGYNLRNSSIDSSNKEIFFDFRLKAFPTLNLRSGSRASFSEPRISPTVEGAQGTAAEPFSYYDNI